MNKKLQKNYLSLAAILISFILIWYLSFVYYPKWKNPSVEATISWDVSGYYMYLPASIIYNDIKECKFKDKILKEYSPTHDFQQAFKAPNGNYVMKYPLGQAIQYSPFFLLAHAYATNTPEYKADGFSIPYQLMISIASLFYAFLGLCFFRLILLKYFDDKTVAITILAIVLGSNYLNYASIDGAMTHNNLFTIYSILIYLVIRFYEKPSYINAAIIGGLIGLATITRPTELISILIPILWGIRLNIESIKKRLLFFNKHIGKLIITAILLISVGSLQLLYWKYVSGQWFIYSYEEQGFSWLHPHLRVGIFGFKSGWLVYSPMMIFALLGFYQLYKYHRKLFLSIGIFTGIFIYITFAWDIWWYGGSLGIRAMIQSYPILAFPMAAFIEQLFNSKLRLILFTIPFILLSYYNLWLTHHAHKGGLLHAGEMTEAYFWKVVGHNSKDINDLKLLDTNEYFEGTRQHITELYFTDFESVDSIYNCKDIKPIQGTKSLCLDKEHQYSPTFKIPRENINGKWIRATADFHAPIKEWTKWHMTQFIIKYYNNNHKVIKQNFIRLHRLLANHQTFNIFIDSKLPEQEFKSVEVSIWNASGQKPIVIDNLKIESYD